MGALVLKKFECLNLMRAKEKLLLSASVPEPCRLSTSYCVLTSIRGRERLAYRHQVFMGPTCGSMRPPVGVVFYLSDINFLRYTVFRSADCSPNEFERERTTLVSMAYSGFSSGPVRLMETQYESLGPTLCYSLAGFRSRHWINAFLGSAKELWCFVTPLDVRSTSDRTQFASDLASDLRSETRRTPDLVLLRSQSMVPNLCFRKRQPFCAHNFKRKSTRYSILSQQVASLSSATSCS